VSIHVALNHVTHYRYDRPVLLSPQVVRLRPAPHTRTPILSYSLRVTPAEHFVNWQQDPQSNYLARLVFPERTRELRIEVDLIAEMSVINPFDFFLEPTAEKIPFGYDEEQTRELFPYLVTLPLTRDNAPKFTRWVDDARMLFGSGGKPSVDYLVALIQRMQGDIRYLIRMEPGVQTPEETLQKGSGSCRDTTWLLVQVLRHLGMAARFVSGYLIQLTADVKSLDGPSGPEADFTDLHAWCEVYLPGAGWVGLDATSGLFAGEGHIPLACSPDPSSAAPISGLTEKCETAFEHHMKVSRVWEAPRVTKPYTDDALVTHRNARPPHRHRPRAARCAADHGRRTDLRVGRRPRRPGVEHHRRFAAGQAGQAPARRRVAGKAEGALRTGRPAALRPGQVVSGRTTAALVAVLLLAP
jgi:transglutaminase-like putative cysteine protease